LPPESWHPEKWLDDEQTNLFGLAFVQVAVFWRGEGTAAGKFAEAKNYSHWRLAYPRLRKESMAPTGKLVLLGVLFDNSVTLRHHSVI
jgi:hypothetical protein